MEYPELIAKSLQDDPRITEAKRLLKETVTEHQKQINDIKPPLSSLKQSYESMLNEMANIRGGKLWFPYIGSGIGNGALVELADGSIKYDFISGIGVHFLGHSHPDLLEAAIDSAISNTVMQGHLQQNIDSLELSKLLVKASGLPHCFLTSSGAMANENAIKIAFQKKQPAYRILAFEHCFAGRTLTISQITDKPSFREGLPCNTFVDYIPFYDPRYPQESTEAAVTALKKYIARYPKEHALMCMEFVQGEGGFYMGSEAFFKAIIHVLKENQIAVFADEVQTFGRLQELFAFQYFHLQSEVDIVSVGKMSQVCATLFTDEYKPKPGLLSQTFTGSTSAIKASLVILKELLTGGYYGAHGKIDKISRHFIDKLDALSKKHPRLIQGPFGTGCMIAFTPYDGSVQKTTDFVHRLFHNGVLSFIAGSNPTRVRFLVPGGIVTTKDIDRVMHIIEQTLLQGEAL
jgi:acetylornithine/N-succinyldiaminopimelate aminotransferase